jgi:hypothetical protein
MSLFLLLLGAATTAVGLGIIASSVIIRDGIFDTELITPGTIAAVGGLVLVGIGLAVRQLRRIEQALAVRPAARPARPNETSAGATTELPSAQVRIPFPPKPTAGSNPPPLPAAVTGPAQGEAPSFESLRAKLPTSAALENGPVVEGVDMSLMTRTPALVEEGATLVKDATVTGRAANGSAPARAMPRLSGKARVAVSPDRTRDPVFNAFWSDKARGDAQTASVPIAAPVPPPLPAAPVSGNGATPDAGAASGEPAAAAPVSVLKSGVVEGMAYTLYSDGSIEAQLPQGTLRFGSITALRNHIESGS